MALPQNRTDFANYILRSLGAPVVEINVAPEQLEDRIDQALETWFLYVSEGTMTTWLKHAIQPATMTVIPSVNFSKGDHIVGQSSKVQTTVSSYASGTGVATLDVHLPATGSFNVGETVTIAHANGTTVNATVLTYINGDAQNGYVPIDPSIYGVNRVLPISSISNTNAQDLFSVNYQLMITSLRDLSHVDLSYYTQVMQQVDLIDFSLNVKPDFRFNRFSNKLFLDVNWMVYKPGLMLVAEVLVPTDPIQYGQLFKDPILGKLTKALVKEQWGTNLAKFKGMQLPGGVTIDGDSLVRDAKDEYKEVMDEIINKMSPLGFEIG